MDLCTRHSLFVIFVALLGCASRAMTQSPDIPVLVTFFMHDNLLTVNNSSDDVLTLPVGPGYFGTLVGFNDSITNMPHPTSLELGRGRGVYLFDANDNLGPGREFVWTMFFDDLELPRSTSISFGGFDRTTDQTREISVLGGTGQFRYARGYATVSTYSRAGFATVLNLTLEFTFGGSG